MKKTNSRFIKKSKFIEGRKIEFLRRNIDDSK